MALFPKFKRFCCLSSCSCHYRGEQEYRQSVQIIRLCGWTCNGHALKMELSMNSTLKLEGAKLVFALGQSRRSLLRFRCLGSESHIKHFSPFIFSLAPLIPTSIKKSPSEFSGCLTRTGLPPKSCGFGASCDRRWTLLAGTTKKARS